MRQDYLQLYKFTQIFFYKREDSYKHMKNWIKRVVTFAIVATQFLVIPAVSASSLENIQNKKSEVQAEVTELEKSVNDKLAEASEISIALNSLNEEIAEHESSIVQAEEDIKMQEQVVNERYEYTAGQLQAMQTNEVNRNIVLSILQAESITEFFNTVYAAAMLTGASEDRLNEAQQEQEKLADLQDELFTHKVELDDKKARTLEQQEALDETLKELRTTLAANQNALDNLSAEEAQAREAIAAEQRREAQAAQSTQTAQAAQSTQTSTVVASSSQSNSNNTSSAPASEPAQAPQESNNEAGSWMSFQATGYSTQQPGLSTHTAMGIDLRVNPRVIAVDPSLIPLGSLVEVQGMGVYVAGDTGGAINGRIIDIHFTTVSQALSWGRRTVNIRVIN